MGDTQTQIDYPRGITFEQVWAAIMKTQEQVDKTERQIEDTNKRFGEFTNRFGEVVEYMVAPNLWQKFNEFGFKFQSSCSNQKHVVSEHNIDFEIDVFLQNSDKAMLVEVKTKPSYNDVDDHILRLNQMRKFADLHNDKRIFIGAIAGVVMSDEIKKYVLKKGFYLVEPSGNSFNITPPNGKPGEW